MCKALSLSVFAGVILLPALCLKTEGGLPCCQGVACRIVLKLTQSRRSRLLEFCPKKVGHETFSPYQADGLLLCFRAVLHINCLLGSACMT